MKCKKSSICLALAMAMFACISLQTAVANNMKVTNTVLTAGDSTHVFVQADVSWDHSWRASWTDGVVVSNWDAAWIFVKYRYEGGDWRHASLSTNNNEYVAPSGSTINAGSSVNAWGTNFGSGVFFYRSTEGSGSWTNTVKLRWNFLQDGLTRADRVDICVHAIEMVYVPQGSFKVGDGTTLNIQGQFENGAFTNAFQITSEGQLTLGGGVAGSLGNNNLAGMAVGDDFNDTTTQTLPAAFSKGYNAFYCMKYEISQGQYADFLSMLVPAQAGYRYPDTNGFNRFTISSNANVYAAGAPDRSCNFLSWADGAAYADWSGLRPMTELEYEKACRGPAAPVPNEYAWGDNATIQSTVNVFGSDGSGTETADPANANINYGGVGLSGPLRCGIYATSVSGRIASGSAYWGIMEMSGSVWERAVTVGHATGRLFTGANGDGALDANGDADVGLWPGSDSNGSGHRGGTWANPFTLIRTSDRCFGAYPSSARNIDTGFRAVRSAP